MIKMSSTSESSGSLIGAARYLIRDIILKKSIEAHSYLSINKNL